MNKPVKGTKLNFRGKKQNKKRLEDGELKESEVERICYRYKKDNTVVLTGKYTTGNIIFMSPYTVTNPSVLSDDRLLSDVLGEHHCFVKLGKNN